MKRSEIHYPYQGDDLKGFLNSFKPVLSLALFMQ